VTSCYPFCTTLSILCVLLYCILVQVFRKTCISKYSPVFSWMSHTVIWIKFTNVLEGVLPLFLGYPKLQLEVDYKDVCKFLRDDTASHANTHYSWSLSWECQILYNPWCFYPFCIVEYIRCIVWVLELEVLASVCCNSNSECAFVCLALVLCLYLNRYILLIMKANEMRYFSNLFNKVLYMFSDKSTVHHQEYLNTVYTQ
jgi:hypothetical protein